MKRQLHVYPTILQILLWTNKLKTQHCRTICNTKILWPHVTCGSTASRIPRTVCIPPVSNHIRTHACECNLQPMNIITRDGRIQCVVAVCDKHTVDIIKNACMCVQTSQECCDYQLSSSTVTDAILLVWLDRQTINEFHSQTFVEPMYIHIIIYCESGLLSMQ